MSQFAYAGPNLNAEQAARGRQITTVNAYARNLAYAARLLLGALLARKPAQVERQLSRREKMRAVNALNQMAREVQGSMPSMAAELRFLASNCD